MKIKFDHNKKDMISALCIAPEREKVLKDQIASAMARAIFDPTVKTVSHELEIAVEKAKDIQEVVYCATALIRIREGMKQAMSQTQKKDEKDDILAKAAASSKTLGKYIN